MKEIILTRGKVALVDDADFEWLNQWKWYAAKSKNTFYAHRRPTKYGKLIYMHRLIMGVSDPKLFSDHIDRNGLNNQRNNLRIATRSQNNANRIPIGKSKYLGVFYQQKSSIRPWYSCILKDGKRKYLGSFNNETNAAIAYNNAAIQLHGEFANLNQIEEAANIHCRRDKENVHENGYGARAV